MISRRGDWDGFVQEAPRSKLDLARPPPPPEPWMVLARGNPSHGGERDAREGREGSGALQDVCEEAEVEAQPQGRRRRQISKRRGGEARGGRSWMRRERLEKSRGRIQT